jgi:hypothetical protein
MGVYDLTIGNLTKNGNEWHIPGYQFCGPGTQFEKRRDSGQRGINALDRACYEHDSVYNITKDRALRESADKRLEQASFRIALSKDTPSWTERSHAFLTGNIISTKRHLGFY